MNELHFQIKEVLDCSRLFQQREQKGENFGLGDFMRRTVRNELSRMTALGLCRLLFQSPSGHPLRWPMIGLPSCLGDTKQDDWSDGPIYLFQNCPFLIVYGWTIAGFPEPPSWYLLHCIRNGIWNEEEYPDFQQEEVLSLAQDLISHGPWKRPLRPWEQEFLISQCEWSST